MIAWLRAWWTWLWTDEVVYPDYDEADAWATFGTFTVVLVGLVALTIVVLGMVLL